MGIKVQYPVNSLTESINRYVEDLGLSALHTQTRNLVNSESSYAAQTGLLHPDKHRVNFIDQRYVDLTSTCLPERKEDCHSCYGPGLDCVADLDV